MNSTSGTERFSTLSAPPHAWASPSSPNRSLLELLFLSSVAKNLSPAPPKQRDSSLRSAPFRMTPLVRLEKKSAIRARGQYMFPCLLPCLSRIAEHCQFFFGASRYGVRFREKGEIVCLSKAPSWCVRGESRALAYSANSPAHNLWRNTYHG
jgi:hypothetical protein